MKSKKMLAIILIATMLLTTGQFAIKAMAWDDPPAGVSANTDSSLIDIELTGFKGSRNEYMEIPLQEAIEEGKYDYVMDVDMKQFPASDRCFYVKPVAYDENSTFVINGTACDFNVPYRLEIPAVSAGDPLQEVVCTIDVTSGDGMSTSTYTLTVRSQDLYDQVEVTILEENLPASGVYQFTSINGFTTSEDSYLFVGSDKAILFDALNQGTLGSRRGGDLKKTIYNILQSKFGISDPDNFQIDVVITHLHGDHIGMVNPNVGNDLTLSGRGAGNGTIYWPIKDATALSTSFFEDPDTDIKMVIDGDVIVGPDFGSGALAFECIEVPCHTDGSMVYLYDNDSDGQCTQNYIITGDAIGSGSYVFTFGDGKALVETYSRSLEKLWNRIKGLDGLHVMSGHSWQERIKPTGDAGKFYIEDMYIATKIALENPEAGEFTTNSATAYVRKLAYGTAGFWYNDYGIIDYSTGEKIQVNSTDLLSLLLVEGTAKSNLIPSFNPLTTAFNVSVANDDPLYLSAEAFGENADISVSLNGNNLSIGNAGPLAENGYKLNILASDDAKLVLGVNVVTIQVNESGTSSTYTIYIRTIDDETLYPLPDISAEVNALPTQPSLNVPNGESTLNDIKISSFKGGRLEAYNIELDDDVDIFTWEKRDYTVTIDWGSRTSNVVYIVPETTNPSATYTINGEACHYPIPYRYELSEGKNVLTIVVTDGTNTSTYTLTINAVPLWDEYWSEEIESSVWRIQDASGFVTNDDMYLFVGEDKAILFDTGMGEGDLRAYVDEIIGDPTLPIEVVITHAHGDHYGKVEQFADCKVYWPTKDSPAIPVTYNFTNYVYVNDGDTITGPKIGGTSINFECIEVTGHTNGSMCYLYDNLEQGKLSNSYIVTGDALGSGSYIFNFGANKAPVYTFLRDIKKLESKIEKFTDNFYDADSNVSYNDVNGLYFLSGHSWQESSTMQPIYAPSWLTSTPLQKLAGIQMVRDMRIAAENVVSGEWEGKLYTRVSGGVVDELRQLSYRQAGFWYNGWDVVPEDASLDYLEVFSETQNRSLVRPNFNAYTTTYTASVKNGETLHVWATPLSSTATITINGQDVNAGEVMEIDSSNINSIVVVVTDGSASRTYTVNIYTSHTIYGSAYQDGAVDAITTVSSGDDAKITVKANSGNKLIAILIDGVSVDISGVENDVYTIENVQNDINLRALFFKDQEEDFAAKFTDVSKGDWYYDSVDILTGLCIVEGKTDTAYEPKTNVTRAEFTKLLFELSGTLGVDVEQVDSFPFTDMPVDNYWAEGYIGWAYANEIVEGYNPTQFGPDDSISRQDMAVMIQRFLEKFMGYELSGDTTIEFSDKEAIADYAENAVEYVVRTGLMEGFDVGTFGPEENTLRSQVAQILDNYLIYT